MSNMLVTYTGKSISFYHEGDTKVFPSDHPDFDVLVDLYRKKDYDALHKKLYEFKEKIEKYSDDFEVRDGLVFVRGEALPQLLGERLVQFAKEGIDYKYLLKFWSKLRNNPSYKAVQGLFKFLEKYHVPICENGDFICWKKVRDDFKDFYTGTMDNTPGVRVTVPRNTVDDNVENECSYGLHAANWDYANNSYHNGEGKLVEVRINPGDVVAVPADYEFQKMRVCSYFVEKEVEKPNSSTVVYNKDYDSEWEQEDDDWDDYDDDYEDWDDYDSDYDS